MSSETKEIHGEFPRKAIPLKNECLELLDMWQLTKSGDTTKALQFLSENIDQLLVALTQYPEHYQEVKARAKEFGYKPTLASVHNYTKHDK